MDLTAGGKNRRVTQSGNSQQGWSPYCSKARDVVKPNKAKDRLLRQRKNSVSGGHVPLSGKSVDACHASGPPRRTADTHTCARAHTLRSWKWV